MKKKIIAILAVVLVALSVSAVSAFDLGGLAGDSGSGSENITIYGVDFNIPDGFKEVKQLAIDGEVNDTGGVSYTTWSKTFQKGSDVISIGVASYEGVEVDDSMPSYIGSDEAKVNGVEGYEYDIAPYEGFTYAKDGKLVIISVTEESLLEDVVVK